MQVLSQNIIFRLYIPELTIYLEEVRLILSCLLYQSFNLFVHLLDPKQFSLRLNLFITKPELLNLFPLLLTWDTKLWVYQLQRLQFAFQLWDIFLLQHVFIKVLIDILIFLELGLKLGDCGFERLASLTQLF